MGKNHYANAKFPLHKATARVGVVVSEERGGCGAMLASRDPGAAALRSGGDGPDHRKWAESPQKEGGRKEKCTWNFL